MTLTPATPDPTAMFRQILVHLDPTRGSGQRMAIARVLAHAHQAQLAALYASLPEVLALPLAPDISAAALRDLLAVDAARIKAARQQFDAAMGTVSSPPITWSELNSAEMTEAFARQALYADLMVLGQPDPDDAAASTVPTNFIPSVLMQSGRPALVIPHVGWNAPIAQVIAIAWKPTREAAHAVSAALPLLQRARRVHVLRWGEDAPDELEGTRLDLDSWLDRHGVRATWSRGGAEPKDLGNTLLSSAVDLGADLLVAGCYGHSRVREWVLGGVTRTLLASMPMPVLMAH